MSDGILWNEIGNIYLKLGSSKDAIAAFTKAIELNPDSGWAYSSLGQAYLRDWRIWSRPLPVPKKPPINGHT